MNNYMKTHVKIRMLKWQCQLEDIRNLPFNIINKWEEEIFEEIDFEMSLQKITKLCAMVVNNWTYEIGMSSEQKRQER